MLVKALLAMMVLEISQTQKRALSAEDVKRLTRRRIDRIRSKKDPRKSPKKDLIRVRFYELIKTLRAEDFSWREVAAFIQQVHKKTFCHSYLRKTFLRLETEEKEASDLLQKKNSSQGT
jgi:hypothetical protein